MRLASREVCRQLATRSSWTRRIWTTVQLPAREVPGRAFFYTQARDQLGELASSGNACLLLRDHVEDAVLTVLNVEYELAQKGLVVFLTQHLVALREIITLLHL